MPIGLNLVYAPLAGRNLPVAGTMTEALAPLLIVNPYGLFATTTTTRPVIVIEGSDDNKTWREYALPYLPGPVDRAPTWSIPYQPRLDWQLWFAAYGSAGAAPLDRAPAAAPARRQPARRWRYSPRTRSPMRPPKYVRALLYDYRFADARSPAEPGAERGRWWVRRLDGHLLSVNVACRFSAGRSPVGAGPADPHEANQDYTQRMQLLETRSVSMIAVRSKA